MRWQAPALTMLVLAGSACSFLDGVETSTPSTVLPPRPERYVACPPSGIEAPPSMRLVDRALPNLGDGTMGRHEIYSSPDAQLEIMVGVDPLDAYEDLDFVTRTTTVDGVPALISSAGAFGTADKLVVLTWSVASPPPPCGDLSLVGTNMSADELAAIAGTRVPPTES